MFNLKDEALNLCGVHARSRTQQYIPRGTRSAIVTHLPQKTSILTVDIVELYIIVYSLKHFILVRQTIQ